MSVHGESVDEKAKKDNEKQSKKFLAKAKELSCENGEEKFLDAIQKIAKKPSTENPRKGR